MNFWGRDLTRQKLVWLLPPGWILEVGEILNGYVA